MSSGISPWPDAVSRIDAELNEHGVWHIITPNRGQATSCREAAFARQRLGVTGIPLSDELKTYLGVYEGPGGRTYVAVHCRAHHNRNDEKIRGLLGAPVAKVEAAELAGIFGLEYGRVNPFELARHSNVLQLFDASVVADYPAPNTMMTNAGDHAWGIEFHPEQLVEYLPRVIVADVVEDSSIGTFKDPILGILTGNGPESGIELWRRINKAIADNASEPFRGDTDFPRVVVRSEPGMGLSMQLADREREVREVVLGGIEEIIDAGASVVGIACNTTQYFSTEIRNLCDEHDVVFVSLVEATRTVLRSREVAEFDLFGIGPVVDLDMWSDFRRLGDEFNVRVPKRRDIDTIDGLAWEIKSSPASARHGLVGKLKRMLTDSTTSTTAVIALTELSVVLTQHPKIATQLEKSGIALVDTLDALANVMARHYLRSRDLRTANVNARSMAGA